MWAGWTRFSATALGVLALWIGDLHLSWWVLLLLDYNGAIVAFAAMHILRQMFTSAFWFLVLYDRCFKRVAQRPGTGLVLLGGRCRWAVPYRIWRLAGTRAALAGSAAGWNGHLGAR